MGLRDDLYKSVPNYNQENELLNKKNEQTWIHNNIGPSEYTTIDEKKEESNHGFSEQDKYVDIWSLSDEELLTELTRHQNARNYYYRNHDFDEMQRWQDRLYYIIDEATNRGLIERGQRR